MKPLCVDLFCGLGGWTEGFLAEGYEVVGFDIEQHVYGEQRYPAQLVLQDVLTIHGRQFKDAAVIVASSPCQAYSYMAMPWTRAKQIAKALRGEGEFPEGYTGYRTIEELNALFEAPKRIQREAIEAAGRWIPMIQENVRGAIPWVGRSAWNFGSYHLWGDVPALMPFTAKRAKVGSLGWSEFATTGVKSKGFNTTADQLAHGRADIAGTIFEDESVKVPSEKGRRTDIGKGARFTSRDCGDERGQKNTGGSWFNIGSPGQKVTGQNPDGRRLAAATKREGKKGVGIGSASWQDKDSRHPDDPRNFGSKSSARKAASARIAKIPFPLAQHIARVYRPEFGECAA